MNPFLIGSVGCLAGALVALWYQHKASMATAELGHEKETLLLMRQELQNTVRRQEDERQRCEQDCIRLKRALLLADGELEQCVDPVLVRKRLRDTLSSTSRSANAYVGVLNDAASLGKPRGASGT